MKIDEELLMIAKKDLQASRVLFDNRLYPQAIFFFQQSVEKANKAFALVTNQVTEKELLFDIGHVPTRIYKKAIKQQQIKYEQFDQHLTIVPELKEVNILKNINVQKVIKNFEDFLEFLEYIDKERHNSIYMSAGDIRRYLKEIESSKKDVRDNLNEISKFKLNEVWEETKENIVEMYNVYLKYNPIQVRKEIENLEKLDVYEFENSIKIYLKFLLIIQCLSVSLLNLAIITLPHSINSRYPQNDLTPRIIYKKTLPIVRKLPELFGLQHDILNELRKFKTNFEEINAPLL